MPSYEKREDLVCTYQISYSVPWHLEVLSSNVCLSRVVVRRWGPLSGCGVTGFIHEGGDLDTRT